MKGLTTLFVLLIIIAGITLGVLNHDAVTFRYLFGERDIPLALLMAFCVCGGALLGIIFGLSIYFRAKFENRCLRRRVQHLEKITTPRMFL